ncbi:MAG: hypothetical protein OQJ89_02745 [Kangiellaceae bacterium]|nr:hypothetical protein [Kangiellaceae bacterium]MCW9015865.1 hypothetical protein [Kangiellaceae bacterium]
MDCEPYQVKVKNKGDLLRYYVTGKRSIEGAVEFWHRIYRDCELTGISVVHATILLSGRIAPMEVPLLIRKLVEVNQDRKITCAWVDLNAESYVDNLMGEKIPRPDCMNIKIFNCDLEAQKWLASQHAVV